MTTWARAGCRWVARFSASFRSTPCRRHALPRDSSATAHGPVLRHPKSSTPFAGCMSGCCLCCRRSRASKGLAACAPRRALSQCCRHAEADSVRRNCASRWILLGSALGQLVVPPLCRLWWRICYRARSFPDRQQASPHRYGSCCVRTRRHRLADATACPPAQWHPIDAD